MQVTAAPNASQLSLEERQRWYAVYTQPHKEITAQLNLANQGFRSFLPRYAKKVRHARQCHTTVVPLFLRYLFVALDIDRDRWRAVNGTHGVTTLIMQDERPVPVRKGVIETLIASSCGGNEIHFLPQMQPGQRVRLLAGPFAEQLGILEQLNNSGRVRVLLEMMGGRIPVDVRRQDVVPAS